MILLGKSPVKSHDITKCYLMAVLCKLITRAVIATGTGLQVFWVLQLPLLWWSLPSQVRAAAAIISYVGSP